MKKMVHYLNFTVDTPFLKIIVDVYVNPTLICELLEDKDQESC